MAYVYMHVWPFAHNLNDDIHVIYDILSHLYICVHIALFPSHSLFCNKANAGMQTHNPTTSLEMYMWLYVGSFTGIENLNCYIVVAGNQVVHVIQRKNGISVHNQRLFYISKLYSAA